MKKNAIFQILERDDGANFWSRLYDWFMLCMVFLSVVPLMFWERRPIFVYIEIFTTTVFIIDYLLRWYTADLKVGKGVKSYFIYPFTFWAIIDLCSILPSFNILGQGFKIGRNRLKC